MPSYNRSIVIVLASLLAGQSAEVVQPGTYLRPGTVQPNVKPAQPPVELPKYVRPEIATDPVPEVEIATDPVPKVKPEDSVDVPISEREPAEEIQQKVVEVGPNESLPTDSADIEEVTPKAYAGSSGKVTPKAYAGSSGIKPDTDPLKANVKPDTDPLKANVKPDTDPLKANVKPDTDPLKANHDTDPLKADGSVNPEIKEDDEIAVCDGNCEGSASVPGSSTSDKELHNVITDPAVGYKRPGEAVNSTEPVEGAGSAADLDDKDEVEDDDESDVEDADSENEDTDESDVDADPDEEEVDESDVEDADSDEVNPNVKPGDSNNASNATNGSVDSENVGYKRPTNNATYPVSGGGSVTDSKNGSESNVLAYKRPEVSAKPENATRDKSYMETLRSWFTSD
ncbi:hypothetical protein L0F63_000515 [Massospora cicadina]|nr:hypothetical protein L0F63_000515 [Massospora cicadina]